MKFDKRTESDNFYAHNASCITGTSKNICCLRIFFPLFCNDFHADGKMSFEYLCEQLTVYGFKKSKNVVRIRLKIKKNRFEINHPSRITIIYGSCNHVSDKYYRTINV